MQESTYNSDLPVQTDGATSIQGQYMGLFKITPEAWLVMEEMRSGLNKNHQDEMHMTRALQKIIDDNKISIDAVMYTGWWGEIDTKEDLKMYNNYSL